MTITPTAPQTHTVSSADGTPIAYRTIGTGPGLVVVHGALSDADDYADLVEALAPHFTVHAVDRRGRGGSGPQKEEHRIEDECDDVAAVCAATGARYLFGHSYGGLVVLEAARRNPDIDRLAVYEPGVSVGGRIPLDWIPQYRRFLSEDRRFEAFAAFAIGGGPDAIRRGPRWLTSAILRLVFRGERRAKHLRLLETNLREHQEVGRLDDSYPDYREVSASVLLMAGGKSGLSWVGPAYDRLTETLPSSRVRTFPKLDHFGPDQKAPREVAAAVTEFLLG